MVIANIIRKINTWMRYRRNLAELGRLTDRELADIGIARHDLGRMAWEAAHA